MRTGAILLMINFTAETFVEHSSVDGDDQQDLGLLDKQIWNVLGYVQTGRVAWGCKNLIT